LNNKYCKYCWPTKRKSHFSYHFEYYINKLIAPILAPLKYSFLKNTKNKRSFHNYLWGLLVSCLSLIKIISLTDNPDETKLHNRSLIFFKEAEKRGLNIKAIKFLGKYVNDFKLTYNNKNYYYEEIPLTIFYNNNRYDDKFFLKKLLQKHDIPTSQGKLFTNTKEALHFGKAIGFPLVVKPVNGSLSHHVVCSIDSEEKLLTAIKIAQKYRPDFIVEKHVEGNLFRATIVNKEIIFICQKDKANITGDDYSTIEKLIKIKNSDINRGDTHQKNTTLYKIPIDDILIKNLESQKLNLQSILPKNKKIYVQSKFILSHGCDVINCDESAHIDNKELFIKIADILNVNLVGIDFICPDISKSYREQETAILECNSLPYIDMHQYPSHGKSEPVAKIVWDIVLNRLSE
jgi:D-alanine-D-alanine ligase-like ATP-grasp enzyme